MMQALDHQSDPSMLAQCWQASIGTILANIGTMLANHRHTSIAPIKAQLQISMVGQCFHVSDEENNKPAFLSIFFQQTFPVYQVFFVCSANEKKMR